LETELANLSRKNILHLEQTT
ncbi:DNA mismatch repair protein MutT, partial [Listeria monocytogenes]|nr:DNA mismatch repair protein MutT [Listeria monocytogenes]HAO6148395.1 DNA mismatch repair protein MutT [Listeria monocytogenes]